MRLRTREVVWCALAASMLAVAAPHRLAAQGGPPGGVTLVVVEQGLGFGRLLPGITEAVPTTDTWRRAMLRIEGSGSVTVRFVLPAQMTSAESATLPLQFRAGDAAWTAPARGTTTMFDPNATVHLNLTAASGLVELLLGGVALPSPAQRAGTYSATVVVVISSPNQ